MVKLTFSKFAPEDISIWDGVAGSELQASADGESIDVVSVNLLESGVATVRLKGTGLALGAEGGIAGGTISSIVFFDGNGRIMATYSDMKFPGSAFDLDSLFSTVMRIHKGGDTIFGDARADIIDTGAGNDTVKAGGGEDFIVDYKGADIYDGGTGIDQLDFSFEDGGSTRGVVIDLAAGTATDAWGYKDKLISIEQVRGTSNVDKIFGSDLKTGERYMGFAGNDFIDGRGGTDMVSYKRDSDHGGSGNVTVDLIKGRATDGFGDRDTLKNIENAEGGFHDDLLIGNSKANLLRGGYGDDRLKGGGGGDTLEGEGGDDILTASTGADVFLYRATADDLGVDTIKGFRDKEDKIQFDKSMDVDRFSDLTITKLGHDVVVTYDLGSITIEDIGITKITAADFIFG